MHKIKVLEVFRHYLEMVGHIEVVVAKVGDEICFTSFDYFISVFLTPIFEFWVI